MGGSGTDRKHAVQEIRHGGQTPGLACPFLTHYEVDEVELQLRDLTDEALVWPRILKASSSILSNPSKS